MTEKCIGECIEPDKITIHPFTMDQLGNFSKNKICPSMPYINLKKEEAIPCNNLNAISDQEITQMFFIPEINFNVESFLEIYNITSFNAGILWLKINSENSNISNKFRILNALWNVYQKKIKKIDNQLIDIYLDLLPNLLNDDNILEKILKSKNKRKIIKKSIKKLIKLEIDWNDIDFDSNLFIKKNIINYANKYV